MTPKEIWMDNSCKRCLLKDVAGKEDVLAQVEKMKKLMGRGERASDEEYEKRLSICGGCDNLLSGTCLKCGCYVEIRALSMGAKCPGKKW